jgi:hypothetical protein
MNVKVINLTDLLGLGEHKHTERAPTPVPAGSPVHTILARRMVLIDQYAKMKAKVDKLEEELYAQDEPLQAAIAKQFPDGSKCWRFEDENSLIFLDHDDEQPKPKQPDWAKQLADDIGRAN